MLVPLRLRYGCVAVGTVPHSRGVGLASRTACCRDRPATRCRRRARRGPASALDRSALGPRELNAATCRRARSTVPLWLAAPTVSTHGALPGEVMPPYCGCALGRCGRGCRPRSTTTMPASTARLRGERQRVGLVRLVDAGGDRQVDDADVVGGALLDRVVDRGDDVADVAVAAARRAPSARRGARRARCRAARRPSRGRCRR